MNFDLLNTALAHLSDCALCPRNCHVNRFGSPSGYCRSDASLNIASICIHRGEEPAISGENGICNIFFTNCNLNCVFCQNHQISDIRSDRKGSRMALEDVVSAVTAILNTGINRVGFVSPSHFIPQMKLIIYAIHSRGYKPVWVYNTNGYDKTETLRSLEGMVDVYLPDLKYMDTTLARRYSGAGNYPEVAKSALREMFRQKGSSLITGDDHTALSGIIVRHLVLPGHIANSISVLRFLAEELSPRVHVSLMAQYYPTSSVKSHPVLGRGITVDEYRQVVEEMEQLGIYNGWVQEFESSGFYRPDFDQHHPFE